MPRKSTELSVIDAPPVCDAGDTNTAKRYVAHLEAVFSRRIDGITHTQYTRLHHALKRWRKRAAGLDARFNLVGNVPGRQPFDLEWKIWQMQRSIDGSDGE